MFDIEQSRTDFALKYGADMAIVTARNTDPSKDDLHFSTQYAQQILSQHKLGNGFDVVVEASGAQECVLMGISMLKAGGTCESRDRPLLCIKGAV
jgi:D-xylulose reductase